MVIDGSMSTPLERMGCDLNHTLWTARVLAEQPELIRQVHLNYLRAGADCGITASYQASIPGLLSAGYSLEEAEMLISRSVKIFLEARSQWWEDEGKSSGRMFPLCLASVGPYGAYLADGSEYRGNYQIADEELRIFHKRRMEILLEAGTDMLLIETIPSLREALITAELAEELKADYWISFSCKDRFHINEGDLIADCARELSSGRYLNLSVIGVNCTRPEYIESLILELKKETELPIAVYPNSGEEYDPRNKTWTKAKQGMAFGAWALSYMKAGASAVGGCCTTVEDHIRQAAAARDRFLSEFCNLK